MSVAPVHDEVFGDVGLHDGVDVVVELLLRARRVLQADIAADPGARALLGVELHGDGLALGRHGGRHLVPGPGHGDFARLHELREVGAVGPVGAHVLVHLAQELGRLLEVLVRRLGPILHAGGEKAQRIGVVDIVADRDLALEFRIRERLEGLDVRLGELLGVVGQASVAPVPRDEEVLPVLDEAFHRTEGGDQIVPCLDLRGVDRRQQLGFVPLGDGLRARMRGVGPEARAQLLERFLLVAEEGEGRTLAVFVDIGLVEGRILVAGPVEDDEFGVVGPRAGRQDRGAEHQGGDQRQCLHGWSPSQELSVFAKALIWSAFPSNGSATPPLSVGGSVAARGKAYEGQGGVTMFF